MIDAPGNDPGLTVETTGRWNLRLDSFGLPVPLSRGPVFLIFKLFMIGMRSSSSVQVGGQTVEPIPYGNPGRVVGPNRVRNWADMDRKHIVDRRRPAYGQSGS